MAPINSPSRRIFMVSVAAALATPLTQRHASGLTAAGPNIVFVFSDEHRSQSMSFTEMPMVQTPNLANMAREGFCFQQCISNYPVCSPYRGMLMTGRWPFQTGMIDNDIDLSENEYTLGDAFKSAGYHTAYIGKWHLGGTRAEPFGFDLSLIWTNTNTHYNQSLYYPKDGGPVRLEGYNATRMTDQAVSYIAGAGAHPYLLMVSLNPPHARFTDAPPDKRALYPDGSLPYRPNVRLDGPDDGHISRNNGSPHYEGYHAHITAIDTELGRILDAVKQSERGDNTLVIYTSDHGCQFGSHGIGSKRQPYEESVRIPFMVYAPGRVSPGGSSQALMGAPDVMPTLCGLAGIPVPNTCVGQDFSGYILHGIGPEPDAQLIMHISKKNASGGERHPAPLFRGIRTRRYTYTINEKGPFHLFDNQEDPYQMHNLVHAEEQASLRKDLHARLAELLAAAEDPFPL